MGWNTELIISVADTLISVGTVSYPWAFLMVGAVLRRTRPNAICIPNRTIGVNFKK